MTTPPAISGSMVGRIIVPPSARGPAASRAALVAAIDHRGDAVGDRVYKAATARMRSSLHGARVRRKLSSHRRRAEWAIEQRKQQESGDKAADMSDPGHRHVGKAQRLSSGAENEVRSEPDQNEDERPALHKDAAEARSRNRLDLGTTGRAERPKRRSRLKHE